MYTYQPDSQRRYRQLHIQPALKWSWHEKYHADFTNSTRCAPTAQITSGERTHLRRLLVELSSLRAPELANRLARAGLVIRPT